MTERHPTAGISTMLFLESIGLGQLQVSVLVQGRMIGPHQLQKRIAVTKELSYFTSVSGQAILKATRWLL